MRGVHGRWLAATVSSGCESDKARFVDVPMVQVRLAPFAIEVHEVTNAQYARCVAAGACGPAADDATGESAALPVSGVSWQDAADYCAFIGRRLPSEVEWERVARGPGVAAGGGRELGADDVAPGDLATCADGGIVVGLCGPLVPRPVATAARDVVDEGGVAVHDLVGNVAEWTASVYAELWTCAAPAPCRPPWECPADDAGCLQDATLCPACNDADRCVFQCDGTLAQSILCRAFDPAAMPIAPSDLPFGDGGSRVVRGASFLTRRDAGMAECQARARARRGATASARELDLGLRCAADLAP